MSDPPIERIEGQLTPLLRSLETLRLIGRYLSPPELADLLEQVGFPDQDLRAARVSAQPWPEAFSALGAQLDAASDETLAAFDGLRASATDPGGVREVFRAMRHAPRALEALYPLTGILPPVNRFFLEPELRRDDAFHKRFLRPPTGEAGVIRFGDDPNARETVWVYVPETYSADVAHPLVMALHGGGGRGRGFLWSWVREARSRGAILVAPTSLGDTWAIQGADTRYAAPRTHPRLRARTMEHRRWPDDAHGHERRRHLHVRGGAGDIARPSRILRRWRRRFIRCWCKQRMRIACVACRSISCMG